MVYNYPITLALPKSDNNNNNYRVTYVLLIFNQHAFPMYTVQVPVLPIYPGAQYIYIYYIVYSIYICILYSIYIYII